jgi:hypothetical protein
MARVNAITIKKITAARTYNARVPKIPGCQIAVTAKKTIVSKPTSVDMKCITLASNV